MILPEFQTGCLSNSRNVLKPLATVSAHTNSLKNSILKLNVLAMNSKVGITRKYMIDTA